MDVQAFRRDEATTSSSTRDGIVGTTNDVGAIKSKGILSVFLCATIQFN